MAKQNIRVYQVGKLKITIDRSKCISCGTCTALAPKTLELDDDLIAVVKEKNGTPYDSEKTIKELPDSCAGGAITVEVTS